ncbi:ATP-dependent Clp protease proteolytic subunit [Acrocarpospora catenulata]|uniref:ATP-dependent Clp protease proteolytic subunit n=1 Tax=Acrocarpospora catenulata TaxID=2836182 RepID=UPI001BD9F634
MAGQFSADGGEHISRRLLNERIIMLGQEVNDEIANRTKRLLAERTAFHTGQPIERIEADADRDRWFTAEEAREYGFIDHVVANPAHIGSGKS